MNNEQHPLIARDLKVVWHPCTQMKDHESQPMLAIAKGDGVWLEDYQGQRYLDAISSWWVNLFGHNNPKINAAINQQLTQLEHVMLAGITHQPIVNLSEQLIAISPDGLEHCFYADNGSCAVEVALKMSYHYWQNNNQPRKKKFVHLTNSYHGETFGALSVSDLGLYKETYNDLLFPTIKVKSPDCYYRETGESWQDYSTRMFADMETALANHADEIAAVIIEPLVQCAGNMRMYHPIYLTLLRQLCDRYQVHLIADEIAVGFGRTGTMFACEQAGISPDFMCLSKGITGGYLPLSAVLTTNKVYQAFYDDYQKLTAFLHSHSYTGNILACSAALACLDIFNTEPIIDHNQELAKQMAEMTQHFSEHPHIAEVRQHGMIVAIEMIQDKANKTPYPWQQRRGLQVYNYALSKGVLLRPLGNVMYLMPPYVVTPQQLATITQVAFDGIVHATKE